MDLRSPRLHVPLAASVAAVAMAHATLSEVLGAHAPMTARAAVAVTALVTLVLARRLFLRSRDAQMAYACAIVGPPLLAAVLGPLIVVGMRWEEPAAAFSFAGIPFGRLGDLWYLGVALLAGSFGVLAVPAVVLQVWLAARAPDGALAARAWAVVLPVALVGVLGLRWGAALALAVGALVIASATLWRRLQAGAPAAGPYRSPAR